MGSFFWKPVQITPLLLAGMAVFQWAWAEVVFDGTVGPSGTLSGDMVIPQTRGTMVGNNLFHSFSTFNINTGESALFTGPSTTSNIISRVTGVSASTINGSLDHNMPNASFWLLNPNGILFGQNASLPTMGAFHATTADYLLFEEGGRFGADTSLPENSVLSVANPSAFGFIGSTPGSIRVHNSELITGEGTGLSLVGGNIEMSEGTMTADRGEINLASVGSAGEAVITANGVDIDAISQGGVISIQASVIGTSDESTGELGAGSISIRGGELVVENSEISANTYEAAGGEIDIDAKQDITLSASVIDSTINDLEGSPYINLSTEGDMLLQDESSITITSHSLGDSGHISMTAQNLTVASESDIFALSYLSGNRGSISLNVAETLSLSDSAQIGVFSTTPDDYGNAGNIELHTDHESRSLGESGDLSIHANSLTMTNSSGLFIVSYREGGIINLRIRDGIFMTGSLISIHTGGLYIDTSELTLENGSSLAVTIEDSGNTGNLHVVADRVTLTNGLITALALQGSGGRNGGISIIASEFIEINDTTGRPRDTMISITNAGSSNSGDMTLSTPELILNDGEILSYATSSGYGGDIYIDVDTLRSNGGLINSECLAAGKCGSITINAQDSVILEDGRISTATLRGPADAGNIRISATVVDLDSSILSTSSTGRGAGGAVILEGLEQLSLSNGGKILAGTSGTGEGGRIDIEADSIHISSADEIYSSTSSIASISVGSGNAGTITIGSTQSPIGSLTLVGNSYISTSTQDLGDAGEININATGAVTLQAHTQESYAPYIISSAEFNDPDLLGSAGSITLNAQALNILGGGDITTDTQSNHGTPANIQISVNDLLIEGESSHTLQAITELENGQVPEFPPTGINSNATADQRGGSITVNVSNQAWLNSGVISASASGAGGGGDIYIGNSASPVGLLSIDENSAIFARAQQGNGGNIFIYPAAFLRDMNSRISADSTQGIAGMVKIDRVDQGVTDAILDLDNPLMGSELLISQACDAERIRQRSSLTLDGQGGLRWSPGGYMPSKLSRISTDGHTSNRAALDNKGLIGPAAKTTLTSLKESNRGCNGGSFSN